jgi:NAD(P)-dependent dehydrogenase (short-subunit alcohol dehydrogenase family)
MRSESASHVQNWRNRKRADTSRNRDCFAVGMATAPSSLAGKVVVITGASSGLGRATALAFAAQRCRIVLASRRGELLQDVAVACGGLGGDAHVVVTDVTREADVDRLVAETLAQWARIDVWVNNAGTTLFGKLEDGDFALHRQVIETNLIAATYCARVVLPVFRRQAEGTLINIGSVLSQVGQAFAPSYVISKFGVRGLSEALRVEVADYPRIHICSVLPYAIDTPHFREGGNQIGREAHAMAPVQEPERVAAAIVEMAAKPRRRERYVPRYVVAGLALHRVLPRTMSRLLLHALERFHFGAKQPASDGNLFAASNEAGTIHGGRRPRVSLPVLIGWVVGDLVGMVHAALRPRHK